MASSALRSAVGAAAPRQRSTPARPLGSYSALIALFSGVFGGAIAVAHAKGRLPEKPPLYDIVLVGVAGHKLARLIAMDEVTSPIRAPVVEARVDDDDVIEEPAGAGPRKALGELLTCPSCVGQWACAAFMTGLYYSPRPTRAVASIFAADAISDFLHTAFRAAKSRA